MLEIPMLWKIQFYLTVHQKSQNLFRAFGQFEVETYITLIYV